MRHTLKTMRCGTRAIVWLAVLIASALIQDRQMRLVAEQSGPTVPTDITDLEAYAVYRVVIMQDWPVRIAKAKRLVVARETVTHHECLPKGAPMSTEWRPVLDSYLSENVRVRRLRENQDLGLPHVLRPLEELIGFFRPPPGGDFDKGWSRFYQLYPDSGGYMQVSAVGFDPSKTRALVYVAHFCGSLCGGGEHHLLLKGSDGWQQTKVKDVTSCKWMS